MCNLCRYSSTVRYHMLVMQEGYSRQQLEALTTEKDSLLNIEQDPQFDQVECVIVTTRDSKGNNQQSFGIVVLL